MVTMLKISVQCGRELNFLHSDITVIILHGQILILYNWRPYLSITPRTTRILAIDAPSSKLAPPLLRLQKHTDLSAHQFVHWFHLRHELRLVNCRYAWCRRLCEIIPTIHVSAYELDLSVIPSGVLRYLKQNLRSAYVDREDIYCIFATGLHNYSYLRT